MKLSHVIFEIIVLTLLFGDVKGTGGVIAFAIIVVGLGVVGAYLIVNGY